MSEDPSATSKPVEQPKGASAPRDVPQGFLRRTIFFWLPPLLLALLLLLALYLLAGKSDVVAPFVYDL